MSFPTRLLYRRCIAITKPVSARWDNMNCSIRVLSSGGCCRIHPLFDSTKSFETRKYFITRRNYVTETDDSKKPPAETTPKKIGMIQRMKEMYKDYWYVVLPVHVITSTIWFGGAYYTVRSGLDVISLLQFFGVSEKIIEPLKDSSAGYLALAFALYKLVTPLRYAVTIGATTVAIRKLITIGWIKPVPSGQKIKQMFQSKKENLQDCIQEGKQSFQGRLQEGKQQIKDKQTSMVQNIDRFKTKLRKM